MKKRLNSEEIARHISLSKCGLRGLSPGDLGQLIWEHVTEIYEDMENNICALHAEIHFNLDEN